LTILVVKHNASLIPTDSTFLGHTRRSALSRSFAVMCSQLADPESSPHGEAYLTDPWSAGHPHPGEVHPHHVAHAARLQDGAIDESLRAPDARGGDAVRRMLAQLREHGFGVGVFCVDGPVRLAYARPTYSS
jgi:hypothetical protein